MAVVLVEKSKFIDFPMAMPLLLSFVNAFKVL